MDDSKTKEMLAVNILSLLPELTAEQLEEVFNFIADKIEKKEEGQLC